MYCDEQNHTIIITIMHTDYGNYQTAVCLHLFNVPANSEHNWDRGAGNVAYLCDHHGDEVR